MRIRDPYRASRRASIFGLFLVGAVFVLGMAMLVIGMTSRSFVSGDDKSEEIDGLSGPVRIVRDSYGIPYIEAANTNDAMSALGYAHAQDRLWQMDMFRRFGSGRLSELLGTKLIGFDAYARTIGFRGIAESILKKTPESTRAAIDAYCRGVNRFIETHEGHLPFEFDALGYSPEPWEPVDCILVMRLLAWEQNTSLWTDLAFEGVYQKVDSLLYSEITPWYPSYGPTIIPGGQTPEPQLEALRRGELPRVDSTAADSTRSDSTGSDSTRQGPRRDSAGRATGADGSGSAALFLQRVEPLISYDRAIRNELGMGGSAVGSNGWSISAERTAGKKPILANDPHLQHSAPSKWYQAVFLIGDRHVAGVTVPGIPFVVAGRNDNIAWGITNLMSDETDFYLEKIDPKKDRVLHDNKWEELEVYRDTIRAKDTLDTPIEIRVSRHGPIVSDLRRIMDLYPPPLIDTAITRSLISPPTDSFALAIRWLGRDISHEITALQKINEASNFKQFRAGLEYGGIPGMSIIYADKAGNIGYVPVLRTPIRNSANPNRVNPGWDSRYNWKGTHKVSELPYLYNPEQGYVASANNKVSNSLKFPIGDLWVDPSRAIRIADYLNVGNTFEVIDCIQMQGDVVSEHMNYMAEFLLRAFPDSVKQGEKVREALGRIRNWSGEMGAESIEAAIMSQWMQIVFDMTWKDEMGESLYKHFLLVEQLPLKSIRRQLMTDSRWFDNVKTPKREVRDDILRVALGDALDSLHTRFDTWEMGEWSFGAMHQLTFHHPFTVVDQLSGIVDIGPYEMGGATTTLNNGEWDFNKPFDVELGPSMRQIVDFADTSVFLRSIVTTGQSGQPMNDHYQDQTIIWMFNGYASIYDHLPEESEWMSVVELEPM